MRDLFFTTRKRGASGAAVHFVGGGEGEGVVEGLEVGEGDEDAEAGGGVGVGAEELAEGGGAFGAAPGGGVAEEEALGAGEAVEGGGGLVVEGVEVGLVGEW